MSSDESILDRVEEMIDTSALNRIADLTVEAVDAEIDKTTDHLEDLMALRRAVQEKDHNRVRRLIRQRQSPRNRSGGGAKT